MQCHARHLASPQTTAAQVLYLLQVEGIAMKEDALARLGQLGDETSLRHAVQLLTPAHVLSKNNGREEITAADVEEVHGLFHDAKYTAQLLTEQADKYIQ
jgi:RuvB-like protein 1 (pontin 52)